MTAGVFRFCGSFLVGCPEISKFAQLSLPHSAANVRNELIVLKNSAQQNLVQNIGTLSLQIGPHETMFAKAGYRGKRFSEFDRSGSDTEFFNTISPNWHVATLGDKRRA